MPSADAFSGDGSGVERIDGAADGAARSATAPPILRRRAVVSGSLLAALPWSAPMRSAQAAEPPPAASPYLEELTWTELRARIDAGATTMLVPVGGTEQSGPHLALGKHNARAHVLAGRIAQRLGDALVAPVVSYVPEGSIDPPAGHMRFPGTISIGEAAFESLLESAAQSFRRHGFRLVVFLGDHGGYQKSLARVAAKLERQWRGEGCRAYALLEYYREADAGFAQELKARGYRAEEIGTHAGLADTALTMALAPAMVRPDAFARAAAAGAREGVAGDPRRASAELGRAGAQRIVETSVAALRALAHGR